jgi:hypothetical protein
MQISCRLSRVHIAACLVAVVCGLPFVGAQAHLEGTCLMRLADAAETEKLCQVKRTERDQCLPQQQDLQGAIAECQSQLYIGPDIEHAIAHGRERVDGSNTSSPYDRAMETAARQQRQLESNRAHFSSYFGLGRQNYLEILDDYFDESSCPSAFRGVNGRYRLVGSVHLRRLAIDRDEKPAVPVIFWQFYEALKPDSCIPAPAGADKSAWGDSAIVNIPRELLLEIAADRKQNKVYLCVTLRDCEIQREKLQHAYNDYVEHLRVLHRIEDCSIGEQISKGIRFTKAGQTPLRDTDAFCQQEELETLELNERSFLLELERGLFEHGRLP